VWRELAHEVGASSLTRLASLMLRVLYIWLHVRQIYSVETRFPIEYHIVGSNDETSWESLYHTASQTTAGTIAHGSSYSAYTLEIATTKQDTHFRYVGIIVVSNLVDNANHTAIQELLLWGTA
jgi:hypothetical protein